MKEKKADDRLNIILLLITISVSIFWMLERFTLLAAIGSLLAIIAITIYTRRILQLSPDVRTPIADSIFALSGVNVAAFLLAPATKLTFLSSFHPAYSIVLLIVGVIMKVLLLDRVIHELFIQLSNGFFYIIDWSSNSARNIIRLILLILAIVTYFMSDTIASTLGGDYGNSIAVLLISFVILLSSVYPWQGKYLFARIWIVFFDFLLFFINYNKISGLYKFAISFLVLSIFIWTISLPTLYKFLIKFSKLLKYFLTKYPLRSLQVLSFILAFVAYFTLPKENVLGVPINLLGALLLLLFSIHNIIINFARWLFPIIRSILSFIYGKVNSVDKILPIFAFVSIILPSVLTFENKWINIGFYCTGAILFAFSWNQFIMQIIDSLVLVIYSIIYSILRALWFIIRFIDPFRLLKALYRMLYNLFHWIVRSIIKLLKLIWRNIIILALYLLSAFFALLGVGLIIPIFPPSKILFSSITDNFMVSVIVGIFLVIIAVLSFKEVTDRRERFRLEGFD